MMNMKTSLISTALLLSGCFLTAGQVSAAGKLTVYCSVQNEVCEKMAQTFSKKYNVETQFIRNGTGATLAKLKAEKDNPQADIWYGGTIEPHFQAGEIGLLQPYRSPAQKDILPQFKQLTAEKGELTSVAYMMILGFGVNTKKLAQMGVAVPQKWTDLLNPALKGQIELPDPRTSGTTYTVIATLIELWGEEKTFEYLKKLDGNVSQYVKSGLVTSNLSRGESAVSIGFVHSYETEKEKGAPVESILPQDGIGYALGAASIIKGARNLDNAKLFMDWALSAEAQEIPWREYNLYQIPTNVHAQVSPHSVNVKGLKLVELDYKRFGSSDEGKRLVDRWVNEIKLQEKTAQ